MAFLTSHEEEEFQQVLDSTLRDIYHCLSICLGSPAAITPSVHGKTWYALVKVSCPTHFGWLKQSSFCYQWWRDFSQRLCGSWGFFSRKWRFLLREWCANDSISFDTPRLLSKFEVASSWWLRLFGSRSASVSLFYEVNCICLAATLIAFRKYQIPLLGNVLEQSLFSFVNVPIEVMKEVTTTSLLNKCVVW